MSVYNNLNENSIKISQPTNIKIDLMEHQKTGIYAMKNLELTGKIKADGITQYGDSMDFNIKTCIGILADKVGSGKSLMIISLIETCKVPPERDIYWFGSKFMAIKTNMLLKSIHTNLLLIPHKLIPQWIDFFKYALHLKMRTYKDIEDEQSFNDVNDFEKIDVMIVTCSKSKSFFQKFKDVKWARIIIDEADTIKIATNFDFKASFVWLVTATPNALRYSSKAYLSKIFRNITPWTFNYLIVKNNSEFIDKSIILPKPKRIIINCLTPRELEIIKSFIPKNILSMINAGNTDEAIKTLNCNVNTNDNILKIVTNNIIDIINNKKLELEFEKKKICHTIETKKEQEDKQKRLERCIQRLETRYDSIKEKIYNLNDQYCPICMDEFNKPTLVNCCQNVFCFECITFSSSKYNVCPFCRKKIYKEDLHVITNNPKKLTNEKTIEKKHKIDMLIELLENNPDGKFLLFANFPQTFSKIKNVLDEKGMTYKILKGMTGMVQKTIDDFKNGKIKIIMLNAKFFGAGMNLQMATHVIIYHQFEKDLEEQVIGRAHRLGRSEPLNIIYLLHDNEILDAHETDKFEDLDYSQWLEQEEPEKQKQKQKQIDDDEISEIEEEISHKIQKQNKIVIVE
jgi:SNF2-related domain/Helicase conserved C-terminal domain/Zinc finger, C3HC4 type (RING finger)